MGQDILPAVRSDAWLSKEMSLGCGVAVSLLMAGLVTALYLPVLKGLVEQWWNNPNYSHGFLVPFFSLYVLWRNREVLSRTSFRPNNLGLPVMIFAVGLMIAGELGADLFTSRTSLLILLGGIILYLAGPAVLWAVRFPLGYLIFMIPLPGIIYYQITFPLQLRASQFAGVCLDWLRVPALREGNLLILPNSTLEVAQACSGIRSLFSLVALAVAYGYLAEKRVWKRLALVLLMVPIAIVSNGIRIVGAGVLTYYFGLAWAMGFFHFFSGWLIFLAAVGLMLAAHRLLRAIPWPWEVKSG